MPGNNFSQYPANYLKYNAQKSKTLALVFQIEGVDDLFGISETLTLVRYGDPGLVYGLPGLVYGGLRRISNVKPYIVLDSSLTIAQRIEPEQGKGNIGTITITLIDKNGEVSQLISPGIVVDEILMKREVKLWLGFQQSSFPDDYLLVYKGYITQVNCPPGLVKFQISDSGTKKRQPVFSTPTTKTTSSLGTGDTDVPVLSTDGFYMQILGPDGNYDSDVRTFIRVDDEIMEYVPAGVAPMQFTVTRGGSSSLGTSVETHDNDSVVSAGVLLGNSITGINGIILALKILLSGWDGPCEENIPLTSFVYTYSDAGFQDNAFLLNNLDAVKDLGLSVGDYFTVSGASNGGNNVSGRITEFGDAQFTNQIIYTDQTFTLENPTSAVTAWRSQYDTLPVNCGLKLRMRDVDVATFQYVQQTYFSAGSSAAMQFFISDVTNGKDFIDSEIFLPLGCYGISRFGRISLSITKPPLPGVGKLLQLDWTNVLDPDKIIVNRSSNSRTFYNNVSFEYDPVYATGDFTVIEYFLDTESLSTFDTTSLLPIQSNGLRAAFGGGTIAEARGRALLNRYKNIALVIDITVNWSIGSLIEVSDIVILVDEGRLKIMNFETGERNLGTQLFEVIDRQYNIVAGNVRLKLLGGLGFNINSRFGMISPSSKIQGTSTTTALKLKPSYGQTSVVDEAAKWEPFIGQNIQVHSFDWTRVEQVTFTGFADASTLSVTPALSFSPQEDDIIDIPSYPTSTDRTEQSIYKALYVHLTPSIAVTSGVSDTEFNVSLSDAANLTVGNFVILRNGDYSSISPECKISSIVGTLVTLVTSLGFTPDSTYTVEGIGFKDGLGFYRFD